MTAEQEIILDKELRRDLDDRFWKKVNREGPVIRAELGPCWEWTAGCFKDGYGGFGVGTRPNHRMERAHRLSFSHSVGPIPGGKMVLHRCDNRKCVNPGHLFVGTAKSNAEDMAAKARSTHGTRNARAKTTEKVVSEMRHLYSLGGITLKEIAGKFGMPRSTAHAIVSGVNWHRIS